MRADHARLFGQPDADFIAPVIIGQSADWTIFDDVTGIEIADLASGWWQNLRMIASLISSEIVLKRDFVDNAGATIAVNAPILVANDLGTDLQVVEG